jgi:L-ascorbate metabolism protein UlaG (beta-lactamase superfamily)
MAVQLTHIGGPTLLIEAAGWRLLVDPTFDAPGRTYSFGLGTSSAKTGAPAVGVADVLPVDVVLLSHDHHADNLDDRGRELLPRVRRLVTTTGGAQRLGHPGGIGLQAGSTITLPGRPDLRITATPARHGPPLSRPVVGQVIGFELAWAGEPDVVWISGDTVRHRRLDRWLASRRIDVAVLHLGSVAFPLTGPLRYSMDSRQAVRVADAIRPRVVVPVHYEGWSHFSEPEADMRRRLEASGHDVRLLVPGQPASV